MKSTASINEPVRLTQFSHGAGCGCKISPKVLDKILGQSATTHTFPGLLVGHEKRDDAAVIDLGDGTAVISTTDFFMPIVDDAFDFGRIAAANAISDVYAMGGTPLVAVAILGWPVNELPAELAGMVVAGGRAVCQEAGIALAGGHSIDSPEPIFGLAVTGRVAIDHLKRNQGAEPGAILYLSKGLGVGILSTAQKKGMLLDVHADIGKDSMIQLNRVGEAVGRLPYVQAMTDVTGFGLLGHLSEMCAASDVSAEIYFGQVPLLHPTAIHKYIEQGAIPGGTERNWASYGDKIEIGEELHRQVLADPQTSGGLLMSVDSVHIEEFENEMLSTGAKVWPIGRITPPQTHLVKVMP